MSPKKQQGGDPRDSDGEESQVEIDLRNQISELRRKLTISEEQKEVNLQESVHERNALVRQNQEFQEQLRRVSSEKDDEIRNLLRANDIYRNNLQGNNTPQRNRDVPMPRQILFDGKGTWESFAKPFRALVESCKWNLEESLFRLQSSLRGEAAEFAFNQLTAATLSSYGNLMAALETRYKERRTSSSYLAELESRRLEPKEKLAEYVSEIRKLVIKGYPTADEKTRETINVRHFIKGLLDQQAALQIGMKDPKTIDEARTILETYNSLKDEVKIGRVREISASGNSSSEFVTEKRLQSFGQDIKSSMGKKIDNLAYQIKAKSGRQNQKPAWKAPVRTPATDVICYQCGELGHFARNCPKKNENQSRNKPGN